MVTGLSGAGRSTAAKVLEDLGWYVVDNLPPQLITTHGRSRRPQARRITQLAVVMDVAVAGFTDDLAAVRQGAGAPGTSTRGCCSWKQPTTCWSAASSRSVAAIRCRATDRLADGIAAERGCWRRSRRRPT